MTTLNLSTEDIKLIKSALNFVYSQKLKILQHNKIIMSEEEVNFLITSANKYADLNDKIIKE